jgi:hypothetical protein
VTAAAPPKAPDKTRAAAHKRARGGDGRPLRFTSRLAVFVSAVTAGFLVIGEGWHGHLDGTSAFASFLGALAAFAALTLAGVVLWEVAARGGLRPAGRSLRAGGSKSRAGVAWGWHRMRSRHGLNESPADRDAEIPGPGPLAARPLPGRPAPPPPGARPAPRPAGPARGLRPSGGTGVAGLWVALTSAVIDSEPEDDEAYLDETAEHVNGMTSLGEAFLEMYDNLTLGGPGADPLALQGLLDFAEACTDAADAMSLGRHQFASFYAEHREAAASGRPAPRDGTWITGNGEV